MDHNALIVVFLAMVAAAGVFYAFVYPHLSGQARSERRTAALQKPRNVVAAGRANDRMQEAAQRRKQVSDSLKEIEQKDKKNKKISIESRINQAGLEWSLSTFAMISAIIGLVWAVVTFYFTGSPLFGICGAVAGGFGAPRWLLGWLRKRRLNKFTEEFPGAVDVIVRGIKAGLPLGDCLRIISTESPEPVRSEFRRVIEATTMGIAVPESVERLAERVPTPEAKFFGIVISIQSRSGGNLAEALSNLSRVLRDRKKMAIKVKAMSAEAKASAGIIGALPFLVAGLVYLSSPKYIELLWTTETGRMVMMVCGVWMAIGIFSMKKMISFDM